MGVIIHPNYNGKVRVQTEEMTTVANQAAYQIPDKLNLVDKNEILGFAIRAYHADRKSALTGADLVNDAVLKASHITFKDAKRQDFFSMPLEYAVSDLTGYKTFFYFQQPMKINLAESIITVKDVSAISAGQVFEIVLLIADDLIC
jgi:hypothetical protein